MQSRRLPIIILRAATRRQCVSAHAHGRISSSVRVRALATATTSTSSSPSPSPPPPPSSSSPPPLSSSSLSSSHPPTSPGSESGLETTSPSDPALPKLVDDISALTLLQAADLVTLLKTRLNIQEIALPAAGVGAPAAGVAAGGADDAAAGEDAAAAAKPKEKTIFNVRLESFDAGSKPKVIKEVKALVPNLTLIEAKKFVESLPKVLKEGLPKEDAEKIKKVFEAHGAVVVLE